MYGKKIGNFLFLFVFTIQRWRFFARDVGSINDGTGVDTSGNDNGSLK